MVGMPTLVPEPRTVRVRRRGSAILRGFGRLFLLALEGLEVAEAEFCEGVVEEALLFEGEVGFGLVLEDGQEVDEVAGEAQVGSGLRILLGAEAEAHFGLHAQAEDEKLEGGRGQRDFTFAHHLYCKRARVRSYWRRGRWGRRGNRRGRG
jgi:hypothetical protein